MGVPKSASGNLIIEGDSELKGLILKADSIRFGSAQENELFETLISQTGMLNRKSEFALNTLINDFQIL